MQVNEKSLYTLYELEHKSEGVRNYEICITSLSFEEIENNAIHTNDATPYDERYYVKYISTLSLDKKEYHNILNIIALSNSTNTYNQLKGGE